MTVFVVQKQLKQASLYYINPGVYAAKAIVNSTSDCMQNGVKPLEVCIILCRGDSRKNHLDKKLVLFVEVIVVGITLTKKKCYCTDSRRVNRPS